MLAKGSLVHRTLRGVKTRREARSRDLGGAVPPVDAVDEDLLTLANGLRNPTSVSLNIVGESLGRPCVGPNLAQAPVEKRLRPEAPKQPES